MKNKWNICKFPYFFQNFQFDIRFTLIISMSISDSNSQRIRLTQFQKLTNLFRICYIFIFHLNPGFICTEYKIAANERGEFALTLSV